MSDNSFDVIGPKATPPTPHEHIMAHVRQIEIICDHYNIDPYEYLSDLGVVRVPCHVCNGTRLAGPDDSQNTSASEPK